MTLPGRTSTGNDYRYGFQGQEKDDEIKGEGNSINYKYRMHDPRVGRFFAVDPLFREFIWNSSYAFSENRVIDRIELEGKESWDYLKSTPYQKDDTKLVTAGKIAGNVGKNILNIVPFAFNIVEVFGRGGPSKVVDYLEEDLDNMSYGIANDMIKAKQEEGITDFSDYVIDRIQKPEVIEAAATYIVARKGSNNLLKSVPEIPITTARVKLAESFFKKAGVQNVERHMSAILFEDNVFTKTMNPGDKLYRWSRKGATEPKHYFSTEKGFHPTEAGLQSSMYSNPTDWIFEEFTLTKKIKTLNSKVNLDGKAGVNQVFSTEIEANSTVRVTTPEF